MQQESKKTSAQARRHVSARGALGWGLTALFLGALGASSYTSYAAGAAGQKRRPPLKNGAGKAKPTATAPAATGTLGGLPTNEADAFADRFNKELWPLMQKNCVPCHGQKNPSQFLLEKDPKAAFLKMLAEDQFDPENHASLVERVTTTDKNIVMPQPVMGKMSQADIALFLHFAEDVQKKRLASGAKPDEEFPAHLLTAYTGKSQTEGLDNTFITYRQLKGKVKAIFADDWKRDDRDLFVENSHLFGGADFIKRFDETSKASTTFLTGVDLMGRDVTSKSYLARTGPFAGFPDALPSPVSLKTPTGPVAEGIDRLYSRMLFRTPSATERQQALTFLQSVYKSQTQVAQTARQDLRFALTVKDDKGMATTQDVTVAVSPDSRSLYSEFVDESKDAADDKEKLATAKLAQPLTFAAGDEGQKLTISNEGTHGNVSIASVTLRGPLPATDEKVIPVTDSAVRPEGAWRIKTDDKLTTYEDNNENKGASRIVFPLKVEKPGQYDVSVTWRRFNKPAPPKNAATTPPKKRKRYSGPVDNADNVLIEVVSRDKQSKLALPAAPAVPPKGEAEFYVDQTLDTIPYWDLKTAFQFSGPNDGIEIRNDETQKRVVADGVRLAPSSGSLDDKNSLVLRAANATGKDKWVKFQVGGFQPYNTVGPDLFQDTDDASGKRADLSLLYRPTPALASGFSPRTFYRVGLVYPGQVDNETRVPVVVHASASTPIVQIVYPYHAHVGAQVTLSAASSFNLQHSPLTYTWTQIGGPRVSVKDTHTATLTFTTPGMTPQQAAWEGLCRALLEHPDFLFTRPRSLATVTDAKQKRRLQLVKIAQDLLARTPTVDEIAQVDSGTPIATLVDKYLQSGEFRDFYFHRVRLYVESHGTPEQDEPARLWTYIALHDRPFKEILTADYTVDTNFAKQTRADYYGHSGVLTMKGFIEGKPGLPHFNYSAQVCEKFLGYVFEVPDEVIKARDGLTASATTDPNSICYTCHKVLTPLAYQRSFWDDNGSFKMHDDTGMAVDDSDRSVVASYPFKGAGLEAFALQAQNKERFVRTILQTHFIWYFGRELRYETDERALYRRLWDASVTNNYAIRPLIKAIVLSPEYLNGPSQTTPSAPSGPKRSLRMARLVAFHKTALQGETR